MKRRVAVFLFIPLIAFCVGLNTTLATKHSSLQSSTQPSLAIWAVSDSEKIEQDDLNHPRKLSNSVWDGKRIKLFGARNEIIAFQVIVEASGAGIKQLSASLPELKLKGSKRTI